MNSATVIQNPKLDEVLRHPRVWRATEARRTHDNEIPTGFADLDALIGGGWPQGALTEILFAQPGVGELSLLMPALARLSQDERWLAWIAPPFIPYAPALAAQGVMLSRVLVVHPDSELDALWAVEQALRAGTASAVLAWVKQADERSLRRLQLAAEEGNSWGIIFRTESRVMQASPAALRLRVAAHPDGVGVQVLKRRGGWPTGPVPVARQRTHNNHRTPLRQASLPL